MKKHNLAAGCLRNLFLGGGLFLSIAILVCVPGIHDAEGIPSWIMEMPNIPSLIDEYVNWRGHALSETVKPKYGNWYGPNWWGGSNSPTAPGDKPPINSLDMVAMAHDMGYWIAEVEGAEVGSREKYLLMALADAFCIEEARKLDDDPSKWLFPPNANDQDLDDARYYRRYMITSFDVIIKNLHEILSVLKGRSDLFNPDEFRRRRDLRVKEWITRKEREVEGEINRLKNDISNELPKMREKIESLCNSMEDRIPLAREWALKAMDKAKSAERSFAGLESHLISCGFDESIFVDASHRIEPLNMQMEDALRNARLFAGSCKSRSDAEKAMRQYKEGKRYLGELQDAFNEVDDKLKAVDRCRQLLSRLSAETKEILSDSDKAMQVKEDTRAAFENSIREANSRLKSSCKEWSEKIREYGWSTRIMKSLEKESAILREHCGSECDFWEKWNKFRDIEIEARKARALVRGLSRPLQKEELREQLISNTGEADAMRRTRDRAVATMSAHSDIPGLVAACTNLSASQQRVGSPATAQSGRGDCSKERETYFARCKKMAEDHVREICGRPNSLSGCARDVAGCLTHYIINALLDDYCGKPGYVGCVTGPLEGYLGCLQSCNSRLLAGVIDTFGITHCRTACQAELDVGVKACKEGRIPPPPRQTTAATSSKTTSPSPSSAAAFGPLEENTDRMGQDYRSFDLPSPDPALCQAACGREERCKAFTYVKPGYQGKSARCWLKHSVPRASSGACCVSGVKK